MTGSNTEKMRKFLIEYKLDNGSIKKEFVYTPDPVEAHRAASITKASKMFTDEPRIKDFMVTEYHNND